MLDYLLENMIFPYKNNPDYDWLTTSAFDTCIRLYNQNTIGYIDILIKNNNLNDKLTIENKCLYLLDYAFKYEKIDIIKFLLSKINIKKKKNLIYYKYYYSNKINSNFLLCKNNPMKKEILNNIKQYLLSILPIDNREQFIFAIKVDDEEYLNSYVDNIIIDNEIIKSIAKYGSHRIFNELRKKKIINVTTDLVTLILKSCNTHSSVIKDNYSFIKKRNYYDNQIINILIKNKFIEKCHLIHIIEMNNVHKYKNVLKKINLTEEEKLYYKNIIMSDKKYSKLVEENIL